MKTSTGTFVLATIFSLVTDVYFICDPSKVEIYISRAKRAEGDGRQKGMEEAQLTRLAESTEALTTAGHLGNS